jgi:hypothetical protein
VEGENHVHMSRRTNKPVRKYVRKVKPENVEVSNSIDLDKPKQVVPFMVHISTLVGRIAFAANVDVSSSVSKKREARNSEMAHFQNDYPKPGHYDIIGSSTSVDTVAYGPSHIPSDERTTRQRVHKQGICTDIHRRPLRKPSTLVGSCTGKVK